jgi:hypothetical protein
MRLLLLLIIIGAGAYFTVPARQAHEDAARAFMEQAAQEDTAEIEGQTGLSLDSVVDFATGFIAGQGRYENYVLASKFTADLPGSAYVECWGAFTRVVCRPVDRAAGQS